MLESNTCVCCGAAIPEGIQVCRKCNAGTSPIKTNGDMLRSMSNHNLAKWLVYVASAVVSRDEDSYESVLKWLDTPCDRPRG